MRSAVLATEQLGPLVSAAERVGIDMPIGLPEDGPRDVDLKARGRLGAKRSSVFLAPLRVTLEAVDYDDAKQRHRAAHRDGKALSIQAWHLVPKIRALDAVLRSPDVGVSKVHEVHPELAFCELAEQALPSKKTPEGRLARAQLLEPWFDGGVIERLARHHLRRDVALDDIADALVCLAVAEAMGRGEAASLVHPIPRDACDLPMTIWYVPRRR